MIQSVHLLITLATLLFGFCSGRPVGFSYAKFSGPVSGPEKEVYRKDDQGRSYIDYVQKPDYSFAYGVDDPKTKVLQNRKESRLGDAVKGEYSVVDPDGTLRVVKYTADKHNGFQAEVITDGKSEIHGHDVKSLPPPPPPPPPHHHQDHHHNYHHEEEPYNHNNHHSSGPTPSSYVSHTHHPPSIKQHQEAYAGDDEEEYEDDEGGESGDESEADDDDEDEEDEDSY